MKRLIVIFLLSLFITACVTAYAVPDKTTAINIAKTDYRERTGEEMDKDYPLQAISEGEKWIVTIRLPLNMFGGGPTVEIDKKSGRIIRRYITQ